MYSSFLLVLLAAVEASPLAKKGWENWEPEPTSATTTTKAFSTWDPVTPSKSSQWQSWTTSSSSRNTTKSTQWQTWATNSTKSKTTTKSTQWKTWTTDPAKSTTTAASDSDWSAWSSVQINDEASSGDIADFDRDALWSSPADKVVLTPSFPPWHDDTDLRHIMPQDLLHLFFGEGDANTDIPHASQFLSAKTTFNQPTVNLDHSAFTTATAADDGLIIDFSNVDAYNVAKNNWPSSDFVLITIAGTDNDNYDYHYISSVSFDDASMSCKASSDMTHPNDVTDYYDLAWGHHNVDAAGASYGPGFRSGPNGANTTTNAGWWPSDKSQDSWQTWQSIGGHGNGNGNGNGNGQGGNSGGSGNGNGIGGKPGKTNGTDPYCFGGNSTFFDGKYKNKTALPSDCADIGSLDFDTNLDASLGYYHWDGVDFASQLHEFAPGLTDTDFDHYNELSDDAAGIYTIDSNGNDDVDNDQTGAAGYFYQNVTKKRANMGRSMALMKRANTRTREETATAAIKEAGVNFVVQNTKTIVEYLKAWWQKLKSLVLGVKSVVTTLVSGEGSFDKKSDISAPTEGQVTYTPQTAFLNKQTNQPRKAIQIYKQDSLALYCIDCGITGTITTTGAVSFSLRRLALDKAEAGITGNLAAELNVGAHFEKKWDGTQTPKRMFTQGIPGLSVPKIFSLGPYLTADAATGYNVEAEAKLLIGGKLSINNGVAKIDLVNPQRTITPTWDPKFQSAFEISGKVKATVWANLQIGFALGLDIADGKVVAEGVVKTVPAVSATAEYDSQAENGCQGVQFSVNIQHDLFAEAKVKAFSLAEKKTDRVNIIPPSYGQLGKKCFNIGVKRQEDTSPEPGDVDMVYSDDEIAYLDLQPADSPPFPNFEIVDDVYDYPDPVDNIYENGLKTPTANNDPNLPAFKYTPLQDYSDQYMLATTSTGNLGVVPISGQYFDSGSALWQTYGTDVEYVVGDALGRTLFFYPDEAEQYKVSRVRVADATHIPESSQLIVLAPSHVDSTLDYGIIVGIDENQNQYTTVLCDYTDSNLPSKIFLANVNNIDEAIDTLKKTEVQGTITGGEVSDCQFVAFISNNKGLEPAN